MNFKIKCMRQFVFILVMLMTFNVFSQDTLKPKPFKNNIGFSAGTTSRYGLAYRFMPSKIGFQLCFSPYKQSERDYGYNAGLILIVQLVHARNTGFFAYFSNGIKYEMSNHYDYGYKYDYYSSISYQTYHTGNHKNRDYRISNGLGLGFEFKLLKRIKFDIMGGYGAYDSFEKITLGIESSLMYCL